MGFGTAHLLYLLELAATPHTAPGAIAKNKVSIGTGYYLPLCADARFHQPHY